MTVCIYSEIMHKRTLSFLEKFDLLYKSFHFPHFIRFFLYSSTKVFVCYPLFTRPFSVDLDICMYVCIYLAGFYVFSHGKVLNMGYFLFREFWAEEGRRTKVFDLSYYSMLALIFFSLSQIFSSKTSYFYCL